MNLAVVVITALFGLIAAPPVDILGWSDKEADDILDAEQTHGFRTDNYKKQVEKSLSELLILYKDVPSAEILNVISKDLTQVGKKPDGTGATFSATEIDYFMSIISDLTNGNPEDTKSVGGQSGGVPAPALQAVRQQPKTDSKAPATAAAEKRISPVSQKVMFNWAQSARKNMDNAQTITPDNLGNKVEYQMRQSLGLLLSHYRDVPDLLSVISEDLTEIQKAAASAVKFTPNEMERFREIMAQLIAERVQGMMTKIYKAGPKAFQENHVAEFLKQLQILSGVVGALKEGEMKNALTKLVTEFKVPNWKPAATVGQREPLLIPTDQALLEKLASSPHLKDVKSHSRKSMKLYP